MASEKAKAAAKARLAALDKQADKKATKIKKNKLRAQAAMGSRSERKKATSKLSDLKRGY